MKTKYAYSFDCEQCTGDFESREAAIDDAAATAKYAGAAGEQLTVYTCKESRMFPNYTRLAYSVIDEAQEDAESEDPDDYSVGWLAGVDVSNLAKAIQKWFEDNDRSEFPYFTAEEVKEHTVEVDK